MEEVFAGDIFFLLHNIGKNQFYRLKQQYLSDGVEARVHGLTKKSPRHSLKYDDVQRMVQFIANYAETHAIITLPGRTPHHWKADALLLPTSTTKRVVYDEYKKVNFNLSFDLCIVFFTAFNIIDFYILYQWKKDTWTIELLSQHLWWHFFNISTVNKWAFFLNTIDADPVSFY